MRLPTWDELRAVEEQVELLEYPLNVPLFVIGPPGSGKTVLAVRRAQMILELESTAALITFNRLLRRLATQLSESNVNARTMHSFVGQDYPRRARQPVIHSPHDAYEYVWHQMLAALTGSGQAERWEHLVIDEGQDLPEGFFQYAHHHAASCLSVFADADQTVTRGTTIEQIQQAASLPDPKILSENHRNVPEVAAVARHFHAGRLPTTTVRRSPIAEKPRLISVGGLREAAQRIAIWSQTRGGSIGVVVDSNDTGEAICQELSGLLPATRVNIYTSRRQNEDRIDLLTPGITITNMRSVKGQEFDTVFILELERFIPCTNTSMRRAMYMLCARARDHLMLVHWCELSAVARASLPPADVLERE